MRCMAACSAFLFFIVTAAGCSKSQSPVASPVGPSSVALEAKAGPPATVSLRVTVSNTDGQGNPSGITNDGRGDYVDGSEGVQAEIDRSGPLAFNTFSGNHGSATRWLNYDFGHPVDSSNGFVPPQDHTGNYHFSTGGTMTNSPWVSLQNLGTRRLPDDPVWLHGQLLRCEQQHELPRQLSQGLRGHAWQSDGVRCLHPGQCQSGRVDGAARRNVLAEHKRGSAALG